ncbi:MAG: hypothetical protein QOE58_1825, partial [Actinomycetota bacterium]|nr:hypothetical protein [Actinomycetota bacterium]
MTRGHRSHGRAPGEGGERQKDAAAVTSGRRVSAPRAFTIGAVGSVLASRLLSGRPPGGLERWTRKNHAGRPVTLFEGPAYAMGAVAGALAGGAGGSAALAGLGGAAFGALDDLVGNSSSKGLRGHLAAARRGEVTTGAVKVVGLGATGLLSARLIDRSRERSPVATLVGGAVIAGSANIVNLLDLRPGRALKVVLLLAAPLVAGGRGPNRSVAAAAGTVTDPVTGPAGAMAGAIAGAAIG